MKSRFHNILQNIYYIYHLEVLKIIFGAFLKKWVSSGDFFWTLEYFKPFAFVDDSQRPLLGSDENFHQILHRKFCSGKVQLPESGASYNKTRKDLTSTTSQHGNQICVYNPTQYVWIKPGNAIPEWTANRKSWDFRNTK